MMTRIIYIMVAVVLMIYIYRCVRKNYMSQDESIFWMVGTIVILILAFVPNIIIYLAKLVGIEYAPSLLFLLTSIFLLILLFKNSQELSSLKEKNKELIQHYALLEKRIKDLENK
ncbi:MAG: DUF2304 domain-containing protein [Bacilli bacterium]